MARPVTHSAHIEAEDRRSLLRIIDRAETDTKRRRGDNARIIASARDILLVYLEYLPKPTRAKLRQRMGIEEGAST